MTVDGVLCMATISVTEQHAEVTSGRRTGGRLGSLLVLLVIGWGLVSGRLLLLYWAERDAMRHRVLRQQTTTATVRARPGDILDRHGRLLATSIDTHSLYAVPRKIEDPHAFAAAVAPILQQPIDSLIGRLASNADKGFLWLARRISPEQVEQIRQLSLPAESLGFEQEYLRHNPHGRLAVHVLGMRDIDGQGRGGIEQAWQPYLRGQDGERVLVRDARNRVVHLYELPERQVRHGVTVRLSLDARLQAETEQALRRAHEQWQPRGSVAILCDPQSCEILAMASLPDFDPESPESFQEEAWMNRAIAWSYEPGSTIKPLFVAWALQQGLVQPDTRFAGHGGAYRMGKRLLHDTQPHGEMSLADVLIVSSNIGMAQIGERLGNGGLAEALGRVGFGFRTGIGLAGELPGFVRPLPEWTDYSTGSIPMGQELMVTPLQMLVAHAVLANGGHYRQPRLVLEPASAPQITGPLIDMAVLDRAICRWVVTDPLARVFTEGTGRRLGGEGLSLFGKTGTSQIYDPDQQGYSRTRLVCSFVCGTPAEHPELLVLVVVDEPTVGDSHYGSNVAAPTAIEILRAAQKARQTPVARGAVAPIRAPLTE